MTNVPIYHEYQCMHLGAAAYGPVMSQGRGQYIWHPPEMKPPKGPRGHGSAAPPTAT